jgi:hypothetical protein
MARDCDWSKQWRAVWSSIIPNATKEAPTSSRQDIWAELRYGTVPSQVKNFNTEIPDGQVKRTKKEKGHSVRPAGLKNCESRLKTGEASEFDPHPRKIIMNSSRIRPTLTWELFPNIIEVHICKVAVVHPFISNRPNKHQREACRLF